MNKKAYLYLTLIAALAAVMAAAQPWPALMELSRNEHIAIAVLIALIVLSEWLVVDIAIGSERRVRSSMAFLPLLTCAVLFPPPATLLATAISAFVTQITQKDRPDWKVIGNVSIAIVSTGVALTAYGGVHAAIGTSTSAGLAAFFVLAFAFFITDTAIVSGFYAIRSETAFLPVFRRVIGPGAINIMYGLFASPIALLAVYLYSELYIGGLVLITLPLLLIRYSYVSKIQLQNSNRDLLKVLIKTIETRDPYTSGHSLRVSRLARLIAEDLGLSLKQVEKVETAALLHDIGKIDSIYTEIIQKKAALTEEEHRVIKTHAVKGAELLQSLTSFPEDVIRGVRHHHERYDGTGYPDGLAGKAIPISSRVIMLSDSIDAMLSDRPYRSALSVGEVSDELRRCAGSQFDPDIVEVVLRRRTLDRAAAQVHEDDAAVPQPTETASY